MNKFKILNIFGDANKKFKAKKEFRFFLKNNIPICQTFFEICKKTEKGKKYEQRIKTRSKLKKKKKTQFSKLLEGSQKR